MNTVNACDDKEMFCAVLSETVLAELICFIVLFWSLENSTEKGWVASIQHRAWNLTILSESVKGSCSH
jgi:hypothetical protein